MIRLFFFSSLCLFAGLFTSAPIWAQGESEAKNLIEQGKGLYYRHQYQEAIEQYNRALTLSPHNIEALYELAWAYFELAEYPKSLEAATEGSLSASDRVEEIYGLISMNYYYTMTVATYEVELNERSVEEVEQFRVMARTAEDGDERLFKLGLTYVARNEAELATSAYIEALQLRPDYREAHWELGKILENQKQFTCGLMAYAQALLHAPDGVFADRILTMLENCIVRSSNDTNDIHSSPRGTPKELVKKLTEAIRKPDANSLADTFSLNYYLPWFRTALEKGYLEPLAHYIYRTADNPEAVDWIEHHQEKVNEFLAWSQSFGWRKPEIDTTQQEK